MQQNRGSSRGSSPFVAFVGAGASAIVPSHLSTWAGFNTVVLDAFCQRLSERMADAALGGRRVAIAILREEGRLDLRITDEGAGFDPAALGPRAADAKSGRGLEIIRAMCNRLSVEDGGRSLALSFDL